MPRNEVIIKLKKYLKKEKRKNNNIVKSFSEFPLDIEDVIKTNKLVKANAKLSICNNIIKILNEVEMEHVTVESSNISSVGYEDNILEIEFHHGGTYQYLDVPKEVYDNLIGSSSPGSYFYKEIKNNYVCEKV